MTKNTKRMIYVSGLEKWVTVGQYVKAVKVAKIWPDRTFKHGLTCWWACQGKEILEQFRSGLHDRINQAISYNTRGLA